MPPAGGRVPRGGIQTVTAQYRADRGGRDLDAEALEFALDALVAPGGVLPRQADNQLLHLLIQRWPAGLAVRVDPGAREEPSVPAQQRLRPDEEARPASSGQGTADRREPGPVGGLERGSWDLTAQDGELVTEDEDLEVLGGSAAGEQHEQLDGVAQCQVGEL